MTRRDWFLGVILGGASLQSVLRTAGAGYQPVLLATFTFVDGRVLRVASEPLIVPGLDRIDALQIHSEQGIDRIPSVTLRLQDADSFLWTNYETGVGFKRATLALDLIFCEAGDCDSARWFTGICDAPSYEQGGNTLTVTATSQIGDLQQDSRIVWERPC